MKSKFFQVSAIALAIGVAMPAFATDMSCAGNTPCTMSQQTIGDTSNDNASSSSNSTQLNPSSNSNASGVSTNADQRLQQSGNTVDQHGSTQSATGGDSRAYGNYDASTHSASASNGPQSMGAVGTSSSGGNSLSNNGSGNSSNTLGQTANGGAGGAGGSSTQGQGQGQQQGIKDAGNSTVKDAGNSAVKDSGNSAQGQGQQQGIDKSGNSQQAQGIDKSGNSANANSNKTNTSTSQGQGIDRSGNSKTNVGTATSTGTTTGTNQGQGMNNAIDTRDQSVHQTSVDARTWYVPAVVPATPPSQLAVGNIVKETMACGPLLVVEKTPIEGHIMHGFLWWNSMHSFEQGYTYDVRPMLTDKGLPAGYQVVNTADGPHYIGSQAVIFSAIVGTSGGSNAAVGVGGVGNNNGWGQVGSGVSSGTQQLVTNIQVIPCEVPRVAVQVPVKVEVPVVTKIRQ